MAERHPGLLHSAELAWEGATPVSREAGDVYYSRMGGAEEARSVFVDGNDLIRRFASTHHSIVVGETGFGTGLNFLVAREQFTRLAPRSAVLHFVSFEHMPLARADRVRFATELKGQGEPGLAAGARELVDAHPAPIRGWHRRVFDAGRVRLSLWLGDAAEGLKDWQLQGGRCADAWMLDGFAPSRDGGLWHPRVARALAARSSKGATLATFTVARAVRDALTDAGFRVEKRPGALHKREVLVGHLSQGGGSAHARPDAIRIAGAGLAGATAARACAERGLDVTIHDPRGPAGRASANQHAVLHPRLPLEDGSRPMLLIAAEGFTRHWLERPAWADAFIPGEVRQASEVRRPDRLGKLRARFGELDGRIVWPARAEMVWPYGGQADLPLLVERLLSHERIEVRRDALAESNQETGVITLIAAGTASRDLLADQLGAEGAPLGRMRGQLTHVTVASSSDAPAILTGRGHAVPLADGWSVGSSYVGLPTAEDQTDCLPSAHERLDNLSRLEAWYAYLGRSAPRVYRASDWTEVRTTAPDRTPLAGPVVPGLWCSTAHASSGLLTCPLAAEFIASALCGEPPALSRELRALLAPDRFSRGSSAR